MDEAVLGDSKGRPSVGVFEPLGRLDGAAASIAAESCVDEVVLGDSKGRPSVGVFESLGGMVLTWWSGGLCCRWILRGRGRVGRQQRSPLR